MLFNCGIGDDSFFFSIFSFFSFHFLTLQYCIGLDCKEIQSVHSEGEQSWVFIGRTDAEAETPILWPPDAKSWLTGKDPDAGRDWGQEKKGTTEAEMAGWHHRPNGHEFKWTPGVGDGQGGLVCCNSWGCKESDTTEWLNWTETWLTVTSSLLYPWLYPKRYKELTTHRLALVCEATACQISEQRLTQLCKTLFLRDGRSRNELALTQNPPFTS